MNKLVKGAVAGAAGIILLMGGAGSLAYWNDSVNAGPAAGSNTITAGTLTITAPSAGSWTKALFDGSNVQKVAPAAVANLSAVRVVPGNRLVYTQSFNVVGTGDDLFFTISKTNGSVNPASAGTADTALAAAINGSGSSSFAVSSVTGGTVAPTGVTSGVYKVTSNAGTPATITVTWTIDIPFGSAVDNSTKGGVVTLTQGAITLTQVAAP
jgi:alternate signal-mediated exported protein